MLNTFSYNLLIDFIKNCNLDFPDEEDRKKVLKGINDLLNALWVGVPQKEDLERLCNQWKEIISIYESYGKEDEGYLASTLYLRLIYWRDQLIKK